ncbi:MAG: STAS domain-containing protein [Planctomycetota bacterium]
MEITIETTPSVDVASPQVESLDADNAKTFGETLSPQLEGKKPLLVDLSTISFIDSAGLGAILSCLRRKSSSGGSLALCNMSRQVASTFRLVRMDRIIDIFENRDEALKNLGK